MRNRDDDLRDYYNREEEGLDPEGTIELVMESAVLSQAVKKLMENRIYNIYNA